MVALQLILFDVYIVVGPKYSGQHESLHAVFFNGSDYLLWSLQAEQKKVQQEREEKDSLVSVLAVHLILS